MPIPLRLAPLALVIALVGCQPAPPPSASPEAAPAVPQPVLATYADTLAMRAYEASGGLEAWASVPFLRFDFGVERDGERSVFRHHLWDRQTGAYRVEWSPGEDTTYVAVFDVDTQDGDVYLNGDPVTAEVKPDLMAQAYRAYINDTYWMLFPIKLMDEGVNRTYMPDSSQGTTEVIHLTFGNVGMTPGDQYWATIDAATGQVTDWSFVLQSRPEGPARAYTWTDYVTLEAPGGPIEVAQRKQAAGGGVALLTDNVAVLTEVTAEQFAQPTAWLDS
ncbi:MAG: hypothetical protein AAGI71_00695 [Bacteroidota bacterium]